MTKEEAIALTGCKSGIGLAKIVRRDRTTVSHKKGKLPRAWELEIKEYLRMKKENSNQAIS